MLKRVGCIQAPVITIQVADIEAALAKIEAAGGKKLLGTIDVGPGLSAYFEDPEGNVMGIYQLKKPVT
jgi:predicted enzyme related to lactoylglutathione lyase